QASLQPTLPASTIFESWLPMDSELPEKSNCNVNGFLVSERETISPSATASTKIFKETAIPENYRPRGSAIAA
ncbi:hypothetical protein, partial [Bradyrhizobium sp. Ai1a-2]|uniref:hypothetical protein n=1 Tax=Bradyrhizobium sp. Ai1a-2 TaxID=196490 RepID=UPI001AEBBB13